jgi:hypothetical protein
MDYRIEFGRLDDREDITEALAGWVGLKVTVGGAAAKIAGKPVT